MSTIAVGYAPTTRPVRHLHAVPAAQRRPELCRPELCRPELCLTRRGRFVLLIAALAAVLLMGVTLGGSTAATDQAGTPAATHMITVLAGQTLWEIATAANPSGDIRQTVDDIMKLNSLPNAAGLQMGREIAVPAYKK